MFKFNKKSTKKAKESKNNAEVPTNNVNEFEIRLSKTRQEIFTLLNEMIDNFENVYTEIVKTENKSTLSTIDEQIILAKKLIFGIKEETFTGLSSIPDHNKIKTLYNMMIRDYVSFSNSARHLNKLALYFDNYINKISEIVHENFFSKGDFYEYAREEDIRFVDMINSFSQDMTYISGLSSRLSYMTSQCERGENKQELITHYKIDSFKPSYFKHILQLKNEIRLFFPVNMIYGETNNIMRMYDTVFNFIFSDFISIYHTLMVISHPQTTTNFNNFKLEITAKLDN